LEIEKLLAKKRKSEGGKLGRELQLGIAPNDAKPEIEFKGKATEIVAKKAGLSTRTLERGKKILEKAAEEDKQKLREGKVSISRIYQEIVAPEAEPENVQETTKVVPEAEDPHVTENKAALLNMLNSLEQKQLFCPSCGQAMTFECSRCHKSLKESLNQ
jgi:hypothetical protein